MTNINSLGTFQLKRRSGSFGEGIQTKTYTQRRQNLSTMEDILWNEVEDHPYKELRSSFTGYDIVDYHKHLSRGYLLPQTPFRKVSVDGEGASRGDVQTTDGDQNMRFYFTSGNGSPPRDLWMIPDDDPDVVAVPVSEFLAQKAAANIYSQGHDTLTFLAELSKTRRLFADALRRLLQLDMPKGIRGVSSEWLAGRYGWRILLFDIQSINDALTEFDSTRKRYSEKAGLTSKYSLVRAVHQTAVSVNVDLSITTDVEISQRGAVIADIVPPRFSFNPLITGWELIPFSFVLDWFWHVGQALSAISFLTLSTDYTASHGYKVTMRRTLSTTNVEANDGWQANDVNHEGECIRVDSERTPVSLSYLPQMNIRLDEWKILDLLSLLIGRFK